MNLTKRIYKQGILILLLVVAISAFFDWRKYPLSILIGGILGLVNLRSLARGVENLVGTFSPTAKLVIFSILRLAALAAILTILIAYGLVSIFGLLIGFTIVFFVIMKEGLRESKEL
jgi:diacylglycerol kinase